MTENESVLITLQNAIECATDDITREDLEMMVKCLEELQAYRAIGTVDDYWKLNEMCKEYSAIGTIEEFKALKEKAETKKPLLRLCGDCQRGCVGCDRYEDKCPTCNGSLYVESGKPHEYCPHCGQKIDWGNVHERK